MVTVTITIFVTRDTAPGAFLGILIDTTFLDIFIFIVTEDDDNNADENFAGSMSRD